MLLRQFESSMWVRVMAALQRAGISRLGFVTDPSGEVARARL